MHKACLPMIQILLHVHCTCSTGMQKFALRKTFLTVVASVVALVMQQQFFEQHALLTSLLLLE
jgi:hypothetical protein